MERKTEERKEGTILWKKIGGGSFRLPNRIIKPNQKFFARLEDIPQAFRDVVIPLDDISKKENEMLSAEQNTAPTVYVIKHRAAGWYDVVNKETEKPINEKALKKDDAEQLLSSLQ